MRGSGDKMQPIENWPADQKKDCIFFLESLKGADFHWFFIQAVEALEHELYIPAVSSFLNGIEATLRVSLQQISDPEVPREPSPYRVLSNRLILDAHALGMPVEMLAFPGEGDFLEKLRSAKPNREDVEVVRIRNNICHGNVFEFVNCELGDGYNFFTPECLRDLAATLLATSKQWAHALGTYRNERLYR